jgi:hypothetical protein
VIPLVIRKGLSIAELKVKAREEHAKQHIETTSHASTSTARTSATTLLSASSPTSSIKIGPPLGTNVRKDSSPVKASFMIINNHV